MLACIALYINGKLCLFALWKFAQMFPVESLIDDAEVIKVNNGEREKYTESALNASNTVHEPNEYGSRTVFERFATI